MPDYTLEETKNMSRALRHADYAAFRGMLKAEERFTPWLDALEKNEWERIHFEWLDAQWIQAPQNDVESIVMSAIGDGLIEKENWPLAYNCLTRLPDSTKAQRKRAQVLDNYIKTTPKESIETAYFNQALAFYETDHALREDIRQHQKAYYDLALQQFDESSLKQTLQELTFHEEIITPLDAIKRLLDSLDSKNWAEASQAAQRLTHAMDEAGIYAWLVWFLKCISAEACDPKTSALILAWSLSFWFTVQDPLHLRARLLVEFLDAADYVCAKDDPSRFDELKAATNEAFPESILMCAMMTDDSQKVLQMSDVRKKMAENSVVASIIDAWLDIMDHPDHLAQTVRTALRAHPTYYFLCPQFFSHALVAQNERVEIAKNLFYQSDDAVFLLSSYPRIVSESFDDAHQEYIRMVAENASDSAEDDATDKDDEENGDQKSTSDAPLALAKQTSLAKRNVWRIVGWSIVAILAIYTIVRLILFSL